MSDEGPEWPRKRPKKTKTQNAVREAKVSGIQHINHVGKTVPARVTGVDCRCTRLRCFEKVDVEAQRIILATLNSMATKNEQDSHLCGLIGVSNVVNHRPRTSDPGKMKPHEAVFKYKVRVQGNDIPICKNAFLSFHGISNDRVKRLQKSLVYSGSSPKDKRGKHGSRPNKIPDPVTKLVEDHIKSYPARKSHYSLRDNPYRRFLPEDLTVKDMHLAFLSLYQVNVPYKAYWQIFKTFNIHFGFPRSDTCTDCDSLRQKINAAQTEVEKNNFEVQKTLHLKKAETFFTQKKSLVLKAKQGKVICLSFDFMQNMPLPHIPTNAVYYSRQLWYYVFGIHDLGTGEATMYRYLENEGKKGPNEVISMLLDYINNIAHSERTEELVLISDGCPGQNKNKTMVNFLFCIVHVLKLFKKVTYLFPVRGHSYLPNDQDFSLISAQKKNTTIAEIPEVWDEKILKARKKPSPFVLKIFTHRDFKNIKKSTEEMFLKTPKPPFRLQAVRSMQFCEEVCAVNLRHSYHGLWSRHIITAPGFRMPQTMELPPAYESPLDVNPLKVRDVLKLVEYLEYSKHKEYYQNILLVAKAGPSASCEDYETDNDDNSEGCEDF